MKASRITTIVAAIVLTSALALYLGTLRAKTISIYEPNHDIGAYQRVDPRADFTKVKVLRDSGKLSENEITYTYLNKQFKKSDGFIFFDTAVKANERVDNRHLLGNKLGTLSVVVAPDERVVAVSTSVLGSVAGIVRPGDVVSVVGSDGAKLAEFAKVISVGVGVQAGVGVVAPADKTSSGSSSSSGAGGPSSTTGPSSGNLTLLLAVATDEAEALANSNQGVVLVYNPFCKTQADGSIKPIEQDNAASACPQTTGSTKSSSSASSSSSGSSSAATTGSGSTSTNATGSGSTSTSTTGKG